MAMIPKIIHQIWSDQYKPLPESYQILAETWKERHEGWEYIYWNEEMLESFVRDNYPQYYDIYNAFPFDMQRWDAVRFLILDKMGGMHVDFDYECLEPVTPLLEGRTCCIALEPESHHKTYRVEHFLNSALMACVPKHSFVDAAIKNIFNQETLDYDQTHKGLCIVSTTGPLKLSKLYESLPENLKEEVYLIPAKFVMPFDSTQIRLMTAGVENDELEKCLDEAYAVHYFAGEWVPELEIQ